MGGNQTDPLPGKERFFPPEVTRLVAILSKSSIFMAGDVEKLIPVNRLMAREARIVET